MEQALPPWLRRKMPRAGEEPDTAWLLRDLGLHTICESGRCPNTYACFPGGAAFLILGNSCTRNCTFCAVRRDRPLPPDRQEAASLVEAARRLNLDYIFITSVTRDDLPDGGAEHFAFTTWLLYREIPGIKVELLVPDFGGDGAALQTVLRAKPEVLGHNIETVPRLYPQVRPMAHYRRSLELLRRSKEIDPRVITKSGLMLGLGESREEVLGVMRDLRQVGCDLLTLGQYLAPSSRHHPVIDFITPEEFTGYEPIGLEMGFRGVAAAPLVRSSFKAAELFRQAVRPPFS